MEPAKPESIDVYFQKALRGALHEELPEVRTYLSGLLVRFLHQDQLYPILDARGKRVSSVMEMLEYADIRLRAPSFKAERDVHRHVGDFLLFWSGVFPEFLPKLVAPGTKDMLLDCVGQGRASYAAAGAFDHSPFASEARIFRRLSDGFVAYQRGLALVRASFDGLKSGPWLDGFSG